MGKTFFMYQLVRDILATGHYEHSFEEVSDFTVRRTNRCCWLPLKRRRGLACLKRVSPWENSLIQIWKINFNKIS